MRLRRAALDVPDVVHHRRLVRKQGERRDPSQHRLDVLDELLVANLEVTRAADPPAEPARRLDLGPPLTGELGDALGLHPGLRHQALRHREKRRGRVAAVTDQMHEQRIREQPLEQVQVLHVHRRLVAPALLATLLRVHRVDRGDRRSDRHARAQPRPHLVEWDVPLRERVDAAKIVDERIGVDATEMPVGELRDEVRLVRNGELGVTVEHDAQQRRARAAHAEDEDRRPAGRHGNCTGAERFPARSCATSSS